MSVVRLNASHGTTAHREEVIERARAVDNEIDDPLAVMVDLKGPEVRTAELDESISLATGSEVTFVEGDDATPERVGLTHSIAAAGPGDTVLLDDGRIECRVERDDDGESVVATVVSGGKLSSRKGVNLPGVAIDVDLITAGGRGRTRPRGADERRLRRGLRAKTPTTSTGSQTRWRSAAATTSRSSRRSSGRARSRTSTGSSTPPTA